MTEPDMQLQIDQAVAPCILHKYHSPVTIVNEMHHVFPVYLQMQVWGEVRDKERQPVCSTGHNTVHWVIPRVLANKSVPWLRVGKKTKAMACEAVRRYQMALAEKNATPPTGGFNAPPHNRRAEDHQ